MILLSDPVDHFWARMSPDFDGKPFRSITDVVSRAKAQPDGVSYGSTGNGTIGHLTMVLLQGQNRTPHVGLEEAIPEGVPSLRRSPTRAP